MLKIRCGAVFFSIFNVGRNLVTHRHTLKKKLITIPDDILSAYLTAEQLASFKASGTGIKSITVYAEKPVTATKTCCGPECCNE